MKQKSTTLETVTYPDLTPMSDESLWYSYAIILAFEPSEYTWVKACYSPLSAKNQD